MIKLYLFSILSLLLPKSILNLNQYHCPVEVYMIVDLNIYKIGFDTQNNGKSIYIIGSENNFSNDNLDSICSKIVAINTDSDNFGGFSS